MELFGLKDKDGREFILEVPNEDVNAFRNVFLIKPKLITSEPEFKVGDWGAYKNPDGSKCIFYTTKIEDNKLWGWEFLGEDGWQCDLSDLLPITPQEIESHLRKICGEKGYRVGLKIKLNPLITYGENKIAHNNYFYNDTLDKFYIGGCLVYEKGKFAEIVEEKKRLPKTKDELFEFMIEYHKKIKSCHSHVADFLKDYED